MACKERQFVVVEMMVTSQFKTFSFSINLNAQHVNEMGPFHFHWCTVYI